MSMIKQLWQLKQLAQRVGGAKVAAQLVREAPKQLQLLQRLFVDPRVPAYAKAALVGAGVFAVSPLNIPQYIPFIGALDDLGIVLIVGNFFFKQVPAEVLADHRRAVGLPDNRVTVEE